MWYVIIAEDIENSLPLRKEHRPAHLARLQALQAEGRVLTAGPNPAIDADDPGVGAVRHACIQVQLIGEFQAVIDVLRLAGYVFGGAVMLDAAAHARGEVLGE